MRKTLFFLAVLCSILVALLASDECFAYKEIGLANYTFGLNLSQNNFSYTINLNVDSQPFRMAINTGSSSLTVINKATCPSSFLPNCFNTSSPQFSWCNSCYTYQQQVPIFAYICFF